MIKPTNKTILVSFLSLAFLFTAGAAYASLSFSSDTITGSGGINLSPTGQPVTINGNFTFTGSCACLVPTTINFEGSGNDTLSTQSSISNVVNGRVSGPGNYGDFHAGTSYFTTIAPTVPDADYNVYAANLIDATVSGDEIVYEAYGLMSQITSNSTSADAPDNNYITGIKAVGTVLQPTYSASGLEGTAYILADAGQATGVYSAVLAKNNAQITGNFGIQSIYSTVSLTGGAHSNVVYNIYQNQFVSGATVDTWYNLWATDLQGVATNIYYSWYDSRGVGRCKEDNTFNNVGQSICAVYNPQFAKYTPGAANYERIVYGQWDSNVAEIGPEAGGTGTLRPLRLLGSSVEATAYKVGGPSGPTWTSGAGAPAGACTTGSLYSRTDGGSNTTLYVCQATVWAAK